MSEALNKLEKSLHTGFLSRNLPSYHGYLPQLLVNDKIEGKHIPQYFL